MSVTIVGEHKEKCRQLECNICHELRNIETKLDVGIFGRIKVKNFEIALL